MKIKTGSASFQDKPILCPVCGHGNYAFKKFMVAGTWLQALDLEGFGKEGLMLICKECTHIQHFGSIDGIELSGGRVGLPSPK